MCTFCLRPMVEWPSNYLSCCSSSSCSVGTRRQFTSGCTYRVHFWFKSGRRPRTSTVLVSQRLMPAHYAWKVVLRLKHWSSSLLSLFLPKIIVKGRCTLPMHNKMQHIFGKALNNFLCSTFSRCSTRKKILSKRETHTSAKYIGLTTPWQPYSNQTLKNW